MGNSASRFLRRLDVSMSNNNNGKKMRNPTRPTTVACLDSLLAHSPTSDRHGALGPSCDRGSMVEILGRRL